jgi:hypothetical protein
MPYFSGASFDKYLCVLVMTHPGASNEPSTPLLDIGVYRNAVPESLANGSIPSNRKSLGSVRTVLPIHPQGHNISLAQNFATRGVRGELRDLAMNCYE